MEVWIKKGWGKRKGKREERKGWSGVWDEEGRKEFKERMGKVKTEGRDLQEGRKEVERRILEVLEEVKKGRGKGT